MMSSDDSNPWTAACSAGGLRRSPQSDSRMLRALRNDTLPRVRV